MHAECPTLCYSFPHQHFIFCSLTLSLSTPLPFLAPTCWVQLKTPCLAPSHPPPRLPLVTARSRLPLVTARSRLPLVTTRSRLPLVTARSRLPMVTARWPASGHEIRFCPGQNCTVMLFSPGRTQHRSDRVVRANWDALFADGELNLSFRFRLHITTHPITLTLNASVGLIFYVNVREPQSLLTLEVPFF